MIEGEFASGFQPVRDALAQVVDGLEAGGVAVAAYVHGRPVVDGWGGQLRADSLVHTWSAVKPLIGACLLHLIDLGRLGLDDPVVSVWPELSAGRNGRLRVRHLLTHAAGLASVPPPGTGPSLLDWNAVVDGLSAADPDWAPGQAIGEHAFTFGYLVGEVVRRVDGRSIGRYLTEELTGPFGLDVQVGVDEADLGRVADTVGLTEQWWDEHRGPAGTLRRRALPGGVDGSLVNSDRWRCGQVPAVNGHATARGLAGFYACLLEGRLPPGVGQAGASGTDLVLDEPATWTLAGGRIDGPDTGMGGIGGQWACARPAAALAWAYLTTAMGGWDGVGEVETALLACVEQG